MKSGLLNSALDTKFPFTHCLFLFPGSAVYKVNYLNSSPYADGMDASWC